MGSNRGRALGVIASLFGTEVGLFTAWQAANPTDPGFETGLFYGIAGLAIGVLCSAFGIFYNRASAA